ncbi:MAG TPA: nitrile hydratase accessory protein [Acidimicrobiales bacterium]|nr:nitrile hydratase accessory protein [Acidimicrobiales bacterium]
MSASIDTITNMEGQAALPRDNGELIFAAPWEGRSLAMAVALVDHLGLEWEEFRQQLIASIAAEPERPYYESWTAALEALVVTQGLTDVDELTRRAEVVVPPA